MAKERVRAGIVCVESGKLLCVRLEDPVSKVVRLFPPGGAIEPGESSDAAAAREALEETGYRVAIDRNSELIFHYPFQWGGTLYQCTTHLFRASLISKVPAEVHDAEFHRGVAWLPIDHIDEAFQYDSAIRGAVRSLIFTGLGPLPYNR